MAMQLRELKLVRRVRELGAYSIAARNRPAGQRRVVIFGQGRTGSTLLESLINSTGQFASYGELLGQEGVHVSRPLDYLEGHAALRPGRHFICHVKPYHLTEDRELIGRQTVDPGRFLSKLVRRDYHVIYLRRANLTRHVLSSIIAWEKGQWLKRDDLPECFTIKASRKAFYREMETRQRFAEIERETLQNIPHVEVIYEHDLQDQGRHQHTAEKVLRFLDLEPQPVNTSLKRINSRPLSETFSNPNDIRAWAAEFGRGADLGPQD